MNLISKYLIILIITVITAISEKSYAQYDSIAVAILDSVSDKIGVLETCSFRFDSEFDISNNLSLRVSPTILNRDLNQYAFKPDAVGIQCRFDF